MTGADPRATARGNGIAIDGFGNAFITGFTSYFDLPLTPGALQTENTSELISEEFSAFFSEFDPTGSKLLYSTFLSGSGDGEIGIAGGEGFDIGNTIALDNLGNVYVAGDCTSTDFPTTPGAFQNTNSLLGASYKIFVTQFNASELKTLSPTTTSITADVNPQHQGLPVTFTATVSPQQGVDTPTGTVSFSVPIAPNYPWERGPWQAVNLDASGKATYTTSSLTDGQNTINAFYLGDAKNSLSRASFTESIADKFTTISVTSSMNPAPYGQQVTFTATVLDSSGNPAPGDVYFGVGSELYAVRTLDTNGRGAWQTPVGLGGSIPVGVDTVNVQYVPGFPQFQNDQGSIQQTVTAPVGTAAAPVFSPPAGTYSGTQQITLSDSQAGAIIYYAIGLQPNPFLQADDLYTGPIQVTSNETINALAIVPGSNVSSTVTASYVIGTPDFTLSVSPSSLTVARGQSASTSVTASAMNGFSRAVAFSCTGLPAGTTCTFSPPSVDPAGKSATATLTISTAGLAAEGLPSRRPLLPIPMLAAVLVCVALRKHRGHIHLYLVLMALGGLWLLGGCGGSGSSNTQTPPPPPATYSVTVTATASQIVHSVSLSLNVN